jgi:transposase-like protein
MPRPARPLIPAAEVAAKLGKTPQTLRNWCRWHRLGHRLGGRWVIPAPVARALVRGVSPREARRYA